MTDGLMRLKLPDGRSPPRIWNTLTPPDLSSFQACIPDHLSWQHIRKRSRPDCFSWQHLHAVEVEKIKGITFYFYLHAFAGIHIHYEEEPSSIDERYEKISNGRREGVWIYLPIPKNDQLLAIDIRQRHWGGIDILARTKLAGDIRIGKQQFWGPLKDLGLSEPAPQTIVYSEPVEGALVTFLGTYHEPSYQDELSKLSPFEKWGGIFDPHDHSVEPFVSWASLDDISSTLTFNDQDTGFCNGIMFHYRNGGCRTVGQCRWHVDSVIRVEHPRVFQFKAGSLQAQVVRVAFRQSEDE
ncbi:hypothetical protein LB507_001535 [Fusarium sp. FIESC RH6]|nr:hypothetical protein LB507_001535 [Fusarium sp. FIESC RH6]